MNHKESSFKYTKRTNWHDEKYFFQSSNKQNENHSQFLYRFLFSPVLLFICREAKKEPMCDIPFYITGHHPPFKYRQPLLHWIKWLNARSDFFNVNLFIGRINQPSMLNVKHVFS